MESVVERSLTSFYAGKKVFVTGHTGFKGAWLITWLHQLGAEVKGFALAPEGEQDLFNIVQPHLNFHHTVADIRDRGVLERELLDFKPDIVFHLAAQALVRRSYEIPAETFDVNVVGTANLLQAVSRLEGKCSIVVITTDKVYENREANYHYKEADVLGGYDPYSASKAATELVVSSFRNSFFNTNAYHSHQKAIASARAGNVIGGGDWNKDRIVPDIIRALVNGSEVAVRNPRAVRPWQLVLEPLYGYLKLAMMVSQTPDVFSSAYNFGPAADDHLPVSELVQIALKCWGKGTWEDVSGSVQPHEAGLLQLDIQKAKHELNWVPKLTSKEAIEWTVNWYKQPNGDKYNFTLNQLNKYQAL